MRSFILGSFNSATSGCRITDPPTLTPTARMADEVEILGGEGRLMRPRGWQLRTMSIGLLAPSMSVIDELAGVAASEDLRLRLSHLPARFFITASAAVVDVTTFGSRFHATLELVCRPFTYLDSGLTPIELVDGGKVTVTNPSLMSARPTLALSGSGRASVRFAQRYIDRYYTFRLPGTGQLIVDSGAYTCTVSDHIAFDALIAEDFPVLEAGRTTIILPSGVSGHIIPNWRQP